MLTLRSLACPEEDRNTRIVLDGATFRRVHLGPHICAISVAPLEPSLKMINNTRAYSYTSASSTLAQMLRPGDICRVRCMLLFGYDLLGDSRRGRDPAAGQALPQAGPGQLGRAVHRRVHVAARAAAEPAGAARH